MRSRTAIWFETKVRYEKMQEDGSMKKVTESYTVDALSFTEAENSITEEMKSYISGEFEVTDIKKATYKEVFFSGAGADDKWYKAKLQFITIDEKTEKEKRTNNYFLVQADSLQKAVRYVDEVMGKTMYDYSIAQMTETMLMDVFEHTVKDSEVKEEKPEYEQ